MKKDKKFTYLIIAGLISIIIYFNFSFYSITYQVDTIKSFFIYLYDLFIPNNSDFKIIEPANFNRYIKTYRDLSDNFSHHGNMLFYKAKKKMNIRDIATESIKYTHFYKRYKLEKAIKNYNGIISNVLKKDILIYIPYSLPSFLIDTKNRERPEIKHIRGLYFTGSTVGRETIWHIIDRYKKIGINAIVFDAKDVTGIVNYYSSVPDIKKYNTHEKRTIDNIEKLIRILKEKNIYIISRVAVFRDHLLCRRNPNYSIKSKASGGVWNSRSRELWCDPTNKFVHDYNLQLAVELSEKGVDEIQFDYIRFPTAGRLSDADYKYHFGQMPKEDTITLFLKRAYDEISKRNSLVSIDIFGVVAWNKKVDIKKTGQKIEFLSPYCDVISPMLYPSHFNDGFDGFDNPGDNPYYFIYNGCIKVSTLSGGKAVRPWLQAFKYRTTTYGEGYIIQEIMASKDAETMGYMFWNASNTYDTVYRALSIIHKKGVTN